MCQNCGSPLPPRSKIPREQVKKPLRKRNGKERSNTLYGNMTQNGPHTIGKLQYTSTTGGKKGCLRTYKAVEKYEIDLDG